MIEWCFTPLLTVFQSYHGDSSHYSCFPGFHQYYNGLYLKKGDLVSQVETDGEGLYLKPYKGKGLQSYGDGLYLKQGGKLYDGKGLLLGPNSPFANIPILGAIL